MKEFKKALMQRMLGVEPTAYVGFDNEAEALQVQSNLRTGVSRKTVKSEVGTIDIEVPRNRDGSFEPRLIAKGRPRIDRLDEKIIAMYARKMSLRNIRGKLEELYVLEGFLA